MRKIVLAGGTGNLGTLLIRFFVEQGDEVIVLTRRVVSGEHHPVRYIHWDGKYLGDWTKSLENSDVLINLSGKSVDTRFTAKNKQALTSSRIEPTTVLGEAITSLANPPKLWINFSGISVFENIHLGLQSEESTEYGNTFLARLSEKWEACFIASNTPATDKVILRISPVLSNSSGIFAELYPLAKFGLGGKVSHGRQYLPWIHETDLVLIVNWIINRSVRKAVYHACSPFTVTNAEFMRALRAVAGCSTGIPLPKLLAKIGSWVKGIDSSLILASTPATTVSLIQEGYIFQYPTIQEAFTNLKKQLK